MAHRVIRGSIQYTSDQPERAGALRGREWFTLSQQPDGTDVLLAHCEIDDAPKVTRDICLARGYRTIVPEQCVADKHESYHYANLTDLAIKYADVVDVNEVLDWLTAG